MCTSKEVDHAIVDMLEAERLAPEQVHHHVMSHQIMADLRRAASGRLNDNLAQLARRVEEAGLVSLGSTR